MKQIYNLASIHNTAQRCKNEGMPISEKAIRIFVKNGKIPAIKSGTKALILWENVLTFIKEGNA